MAVRPIIYLDNPVLRKKARRVQDFDGRLHSLLDDMLETMDRAAGLGLAAPQVAVSERVIVVRLPGDEDWQEEYGDQAGRLYEVVNPQIIKASRDMEEGIEGCLSIPGYVGRVLRHQAVTIRGQDRHGKDIRIKATGWLARVFQHEIDHLDGILYIDRATEVWKLEEKPSSERKREAARIEGAVLSEEDPPARGHNTP